MPSFIQIHTAAGSEDEANRIAAALIDKRLAACVQVQGPIRSHYRWEGKVEQSAEWLCTAKTIDKLFEAAAAAITEAHSYDEPEIIATPIVDGSAGYLKWVAESVE